MNSQNGRSNNGCSFLPTLKPPGLSEFHSWTLTSRTQNASFFPLYHLRGQALSLRCIFPGHKMSTGIGLCCLLQHQRKEDCFMGNVLETLSQKPLREPSHFFGQKSHGCCPTNQHMRNGIDVDQSGSTQGDHTGQEGPFRQKQAFVLKEEEQFGVRHLLQWHVLLRIKEVL